MKEPNNILTNFENLKARPLSKHRFLFLQVDIVKSNKSVYIPKEKLL